MLERRTFTHNESKEVVTLLFKKYSNFGNRWFHYNDSFGAYMSMRETEFLTLFTENIITN
jgi:hypothetical protein